jgi:ABC-type nitrate/sulfonate/bicarbonate transport system substrate-binding protein
VLEREPLAEGDFYPGDLLAKVIGAVEWLQSNPEWLARVIRVTERAWAELVEEADRDLRQRLDGFLSRVRG